MFCSNCGAQIDIHDDYCPYCGYINEYGAEEKYFQELEGIRSNLDSVDDEAVNEYSNSINKLFIWIGKILAILAGVALFIFAFSKAVDFLIFHNSEDNTEISQVEEMKWQREYFPHFDELYEAGDYEALATSYNNIIHNNTWNLQCTCSARLFLCCSS